MKNRGELFTKVKNTVSLSWANRIRWFVSDTEEASVFEEIGCFCSVFFTLTGDSNRNRGECQSRRLGDGSAP
jgi:hypothetical protein